MALLTISQIKTQYPADWARLSPQQGLFVTEIISGSIGNGLYNAVEACRTAYPNIRAERVWSSRLLKKKNIAKIIQLHLGLSETKAVLMEVQALLKRSQRKGAHLELLIAPWLRVAAALEALVQKEQALL
jgi:hypothetical protein